MSAIRSRTPGQWFAIAAFSLILCLAALALGRAVGAAHVSAQSEATIRYNAGWNLIAAQTGMTLEKAQGPAYALGPGAQGYQVVGPGELIAGRGVWVFFPEDTTVTLGKSAAEFSRTIAPASEYILVGNPSPTDTLTLAGADVAFTYDPVGGYAEAGELRPGQAAFVLANGGGDITLGRPPQGAAAAELRRLQAALTADPTVRATFDQVASAAADLLKNRDYAQIQTVIDDLRAATEDGLRARGSAPLRPLSTLERDGFVAVREALAEAQRAARAGDLSRADAALDAARKAAAAAEAEGATLARSQGGASVRYAQVSANTLAAYGALIRASFPAIVLGLPHGDDFWALAFALLNGTPLPAGPAPSATPTPTATPVARPVATPTPAGPPPGLSVTPNQGRAGTPALLALVQQTGPPFPSNAIVSGCINSGVTVEYIRYAQQDRCLDGREGDPTFTSSGFTQPFFYPGAPPGVYTYEVFVYARGGGGLVQLYEGKATFTILP